MGSGGISMVLGQFLMFGLKGLIFFSDTGVTY
jgi:hypothetical protein